MGVLEVKDIDCRRAMAMPGSRRPVGVVARVKPHERRVEGDPVELAFAARAGCASSARVGPWIL